MNPVHIAKVNNTLRVQKCQKPTNQQNTSKSKAQLLTGSMFRPALTSSLSHLSASPLESVSYLKLETSAEPHFLAQFCCLNVMATKNSVTVP